MPTKSLTAPTILTIPRSAIRLSHNGLRVTDTATQSKLTASITNHSLLSPLVYNTRTRHLISGEQRLIALDNLEGHSDYSIQVLAVDLPHKAALDLSIFLHSPQAQGIYDPRKLASLFRVDGVDPSQFGFTQHFIQDEFGPLLHRLLSNDNDAELSTPTPPGNDNDTPAAPATKPKPDHYTLPPPYILDYFPSNTHIYILFPSLKDRDDFNRARGLPARSRISHLESK